jgi:hypothetical protein
VHTLNTNFKVVGVAISAAEVAVVAIEVVALPEEDTMVQILYTFVDGVLI